MEVTLAYFIYGWNTSRNHQPPHSRWPGSVSRFVIVVTRVQRRSANIKQYCILS
jgi:hypothetical protein